MELISRQQAKAQGLTHYFTGKACRHGHTAKRYTSTGNCVDCQNAHNGEEKYQVAKKRHHAMAKQQPGFNQLKAEIVRNYRARHPGKAYERRKEYIARNYEKYLAECRAYHQRRRSRDRVYAVTHSLRSYMHSKIRDRCATFTELLGCSGLELIEHIESQFLPGMSWENRSEWHIDHIRPIASFDDLGNSEEQQRACFHFTNLQPLWAADNIRKSDTWEPNEATA